MSNAQLDLFNNPRRSRPPARPCATSIAAAEWIAKHEGTLADRVRRFIAGRGDHGATREEIHLETGIRENTVGARIRQLELAGMIFRSDDTRPTTSGRAATVWRHKRAV